MPFVVFSCVRVCKAQNNPDYLIGKTFSYKIGSICKETPNKNSCAGRTKYLILTFTTDYVNIIKKEISGCNVEKISSNLSYKRLFASDNTISIKYKPKDIQHHFIKDLNLIVKEDTLYGYKNNNNKKHKEFVFSVL